MSSRDDILASVRANLPRVDRSLLTVPTFDGSSPASLLALNWEGSHMGDNLRGQAPRRIGVVGLEHMGHAFAVNLVEDDYCDVVVTSLPDDDALASGALTLQARCCWAR
jgi:hypothetical protein